MIFAISALVLVHGEAHLKKLCRTGLKVLPDPVQIASEGAAWDSIATRGLMDGMAIISDGAGLQSMRCAGHISSIRAQRKNLWRC